jgi:3-deoxy-7-phosphoheptulonate synthase
MAATVSEWLLAGEHLMAAGAKGIIFCERGILGRDSSTRNLLDLSAVALLRHVYRLPVIVDPSHALGRRDLIGPMSRAALAAGAHGLMVEAQPADHRALSDAAQSLNPTELFDLAREFDPTPVLKNIRQVVSL